MVARTSELEEIGEFLEELANQQWEDRLGTGAEGMTPRVKRLIQGKSIVCRFEPSRELPPERECRQVMARFFVEAENKEGQDVSYRWASFVAQPAPRPDRRTVILRLSTKRPDVILLPAEATTPPLIPQEDVTPSERERQRKQLTDQERLALESLEQLKLPEIDRVTRALSPTRKNAMALAAIASSDKSLGKLTGSLASRYSELSDALPAQASLSAAQLSPLVKSASRASRKVLYEELSQEFAPPAPAPLIEPLRASVTKIHNLEDVDRLRIEFLTRLAFGKKTPSKERFVAWFEGLKQAPIAERSRMRAICQAVTHFRDQFEMKLVHKGKEVTLALPAGGGRGAGSFCLNPRFGEGPSVGIGQELPADLALL